MATMGKPLKCAAASEIGFVKPMSSEPPTIALTTDEPAWMTEMSASIPACWK